jgi:hypothetical protein
MAILFVDPELHQPQLVRTCKCNRVSTKPGGSVPKVSNPHRPLACLSGDHCALMNSALPIVLGASAQ